jgi:hypothetical protein
LAAGPGSDFSEVPVLGCKPAALEPVAPAGCRQPGQNDGELADGMETVHDNLL